MRIKGLLFITLLAAPLAGFSQRNMPVKFDLGIKFGANFSQLNGENWESGYKTNLMGRLFGGIKGGRVGVAIEGLFSQSTYNTGKDFHSLYIAYYNDAKDSLKQGSFRVNYLNIPVLLQIKLLPALWFQVGPQYSGIVSVSDKDKLLKDAKGLFSNGDLSGVVGANIRLPAHLQLSGRYVFGLTDTKNTDLKTAPGTVADEWKQRSIQVAIGYNFLQ